MAGAMLPNPNFLHSFRKKSETICFYTDVGNKLEMQQVSLSLFIHTLVFFAHPVRPWVDSWKRYTRANGFENAHAKNLLEGINNPQDGQVPARKKGRAGLKLKSGSYVTQNNSHDTYDSDFPTLPGTAAPHILPYYGNTDGHRNISWFRRLHGIPYKTNTFINPGIQLSALPYPLAKQPERQWKLQKEK